MSVTDQRRLLMRVDELVVDGYLNRDRKNPNVLVLTFKGLDVLVSFADRPVRKTSLKKPTKELLKRELGECVVRVIRD